MRSLGSGEKPNLTLISVPGTYATAESMKALANGQNVFIFSDNVSVEDEVELKRVGVEKGLLVMGPDCGTGKVHGVPLGFINEVRSGPIGLIGAAGTGLQEVSTLIDQFGEGVSEIIGVGGRDLSSNVKGSMTFFAIEKLLKDENTKIILIVSKPPAPEVAQKIIEYTSTASKPIVCCFIASSHSNTAGPYLVSTLEDGALVATALAKGISYQTLQHQISSRITSSPASFKNKSLKAGKIMGLFSGGTFTYETSFLFKQFKKQEKYAKLEYEVIDLGDDQFTVGVPHPMIDFTTRNKWIEEQTGVGSGVSVLLLDVVLGHGAHSNPADALSPALSKALLNNPNLHIIAHICGTNTDPQTLSQQQKILSDLGVLLLPTSRQAAQVAAEISLGFTPSVPSSFDYYSVFDKLPSSSSPPVVSTGVINLGLKQFEDVIREKGIKVYSPDWKPPVEGNRSVGLMVAELQDADRGVGKIVKQANEKAVEIMLGSEAVLKSVDVASNVIPFLRGQKAILHAGPPIQWNRMCGPMKGAIVGAILFEGWASSEESAWKLAESGEIRFDACNNHNAVGPMSGIISPSFPVFVVENENKSLVGSSTRNFAYSSMNEGLGKVLRFGAYDSSVLNRLHWMKNTLAPVLGEIFQKNPVSLSSITSKALQMGDECHNRNAASTSLLFKDIAISLMRLDHVPNNIKVEILEFLNNNNHFFLNLSMAACKVILESAHGIHGSTVVTTMSRNGVDFGVRVSGITADTRNVKGEPINEWFTSKSPIVDGLYFPGFSSADANPDLGDSSITETFGLGASAMAASPAIVGFVGGSSSSAILATQEMKVISLATNTKLPIAAIDFAGTPLAFDVRRICDTSITPLINTGIAHKNAGIGQIGAGICRAPFSPFRDALSAVYSTLPPSFSFKHHYHTKAPIRNVNSSPHLPFSSFHSLPKMPKSKIVSLIRNTKL